MAESDDMSPPLTEPLLPLLPDRDGEFIQPVDRHAPQGVPAVAPGAAGGLYDLNQSAVPELGQIIELQSKPELLNELLASGALAASFTAASTVAKAALEARTQQHRTTVEAETERLRIAAEERTAALQAREETERARASQDREQAAPDARSAEARTAEARTAEARTAEARSPEAPPA